MQVENFTQFCVRHGYPSDYDITDHATLSPSGHCSKRAKNESIKALETRLSLNRLAHREYEAAIMQGNIVDPSKQYTIEEITRRQEEIQKRLNDGRKSQLISRIELLQGVGKGKTGKIRPSYQREIDKCKAELATI